MPIGAAHDFEDLAEICHRNLLVKEVGHRVDEDQARLFPLEWVLENVRMEGDLEAVGVLGYAHALQPLSHPLGVAMLTPFGHPAAPCHRIPGGVGIFYSGGGGHDYNNMLHKWLRRSHFESVGLDLARNGWKKVVKARLSWNVDGTIVLTIR
jgi:hypothetical protein